MAGPGMTLPPVLTAAGESASWRAPATGSAGAGSVQRERSGHDLARRLVRTDDDPGAGDLAVHELQARRDGAIREQALARPDDQGEDPQAVLVDEAVAQQRLDQVAAAMHLQLRAVALLERRDALGGVPLDQDRSAPLERGMTARRDVLGGLVQGLGAGLLRGVRPVGGEDVVGLAPENEVERGAHRLAHDLAHLLVPVVHRPAAVPEAAVVVLAWSTRSLHDPVEGQEGVHDQLSHLWRPFDRGSQFE